MQHKFKSLHEKNKQTSNKELYSSINKNKKKEEADRRPFLENVSEQLKLPPDVLAGAPILTAMGRNEVCIENYKGILEYNDTFVKVLSKIGIIRVEGKNLNIPYFTNDEMRITGLVSAITYITQNKTEGVR